CICQVLHEKITILVTHQWQYLKDASQILLLEKGEMVQKGTYAELLKSGVDFASLLKKENEEAEPSPVPESPTMRTQTSSESSVQSQQSSTPLLKDAAAEDQDTENIQDTLSEERRLEGKVGFKTYKNYFRAGAHWSVIIFLVLVSIAAQVAYILEDWWLLNWANEQDTLNTMAYEKENITERVDLDWYLGIFSGLTASSLLFGVTRSLLALYILVNSSQTLHNKMLKTILRVPVLFFDRNPAGRILNRFSKDIGYMDDVLPSSFQKFMQTLLQVIGVVVVVVMVIPWIAIPVIPLGILFFFLRRYFLETSRDVKRLECSTQSLVFSHLASSLQGLWTIRAYKAEQRFQELFDSHQDLHSDDFSRKGDRIYRA
ncbi:ATP-binding cassette sub-family C member 4-like, partial [Bos taurus]|uniref:ATP-binding cassette sub-family C member 4-like n=1 Tax=Bos taurus TaxID=9913 RepID=UPI0028CB79DA